MGSNPFKGKAREEVGKLLKAKGYKPKGKDAVNGHGTFVNPKTNRGYHIDADHPLPKGPHVGVGRPRGFRKIDGVPAVKDYPL